MSPLFQSDVIPSQYKTRTAGGGEASNKNLPGGDYRLHDGIIVKVNYPEETKLNQITYDVDLNVFEDGVYTVKTYKGCQLINDFAGLADKSFFTLREHPESDRKDGKTTPLGSKVLVLCLNGSIASPVILGGVRHQNDSDKGEKDKGHHAYFVFNGVKFSVNDDGSWQLEQQGPTDIKGQPDFSNSKVHPDGSKSAVKEADVGTTVKVESNGNLTISTNGGKEQVLVNHQDGSITFKASKIKLGSTEATERLVLGNKWKSLMEKLINAINKIQVPTSSGPSGTPINAVEFNAIKKDLEDALSDFVYTQEKPNAE